MKAKLQAKESQKRGLGVYQQVKKYEFALWVCACVFCEYFCFVQGIFFTEPDDVIIAAQLAGAYGTGFESWGVPYVSVFLSAPFAMFAQSTHYFLTWPFVMLGFHAWAFIILHLSVCKRETGILPHVLMLFFQWFSLCAFTYTAIATLLSAAGCLLLSSAEKLNPPPRRFAIATLVLGFLLRPEAGALGVLLAAPAVISLRESWLQRAQVLLLASALSFGAASLGNAAYFSATPALQAYSAWNEASTQIRDYSIDVSAENLEQVGWSQNDWSALTSWTFNDREFFSPEQLRAFSELVTTEQRYQTNPKEVLRAVLTWWPHITISALVLCLIALLASAGSPQRIRAALAATLLVVFAVFVLLAIRKRFVTRVLVPSATVSMILAALLFETDREINRRAQVIVCCLAIAACGWMSQERFDQQTQYTEYRAVFKSELVDSLVATFAEHTDELFAVIPSWPTVCYQTVRIEEYDYALFLPNVIDIGDWSDFSPGYYWRMAHFPAINPDRLMSELVDNEQAYIVSALWHVHERFEYLQVFAQEHVDSRAHVQEVWHEIGGENGASVYQLTTEAS